MGKYVAVLLLMTAGHTLSWLQNNSQFAWEWWRDKPLIAVCTYAIPCGLLFWYGSKLGYEAFSSVWSIRFVAFAISYITFPLMTWVFLGESFLNFKTLICIVLSVIIVLIQIYWR